MVVHKFSCHIHNQEAEESKFNVSMVSIDALVYSIRSHLSVDFRFQRLISSRQDRKLLHAAVNSSLIYVKFFFSKTKQFRLCSLERPLCCRLTF